MENLITPSVQTAQDIIADYVHRSGLRVTPDVPLTPGILAAYSKKLDLIKIIPVEKFRDLEQYYSVLFHELAHSTGHPDRYDRWGVGAKPGGLDYMHEELIAELASTFLDAESGVQSTSMDHSFYLGGVIEAIGAGPDTIMWAAEHAIDATDVILGRESQAARKLLAA